MGRGLSVMDIGAEKASAEIEAMTREVLDILERTPAEA
jgi:hypothetical protein